MIHSLYIPAMRFKQDAVPGLMIHMHFTPDKVGEFFGLYGLAGKFSAVTGPVLYGVTVAALLPRLRKRTDSIASASSAVRLWVAS